MTMGFFNKSKDVTFIEKSVINNFQRMERFADSLNGGRRERRKLAQNNNSKYTDPDYLQRCDENDRRIIQIWSR